MSDIYAITKHTKEGVVNYCICNAEDKETLALKITELYDNLKSNEFMELEQWTDGNLANIVEYSMIMCMIPEFQKKAKEIETRRDLHGGR